MGSWMGDEGRGEMNLVLWEGADGPLSDSLQGLTHKGPCVQTIGLVVCLPQTATSRGKDLGNDGFLDGVDGDVTR